MAGHPWGGARYNEGGVPREMPWLVSPGGVRATPKPALEPKSCTVWMENNGLAACDPIGYVGQQKLPPEKLPEIMT